MPAPNVGPDADQVRTSLIKPGHTFNATLHRAWGDLQPRGSKQIAQEVKPPADSTDERLVGVLLELQLRQRLVHQANRRTVTIR